MTSGAKRKYLARQRVVLAIYRLADDDGLFCWATNQELAVEAKLGAETIREHLHELEREGAVVTFRNSSSNSHRRQTVLMDHPTAEENVASLLKAGRCLGRHSAVARGIYVDGRPWEAQER
jgi:hypothetical protein